MRIVPLRIYFNENCRAKIEIALAHGKQLHDKRETDRRAAGIGRGANIEGEGMRTRLQIGLRSIETRDQPDTRVKSLPTASATIKGFEVMRMIRKRQCLMLESGTAGEVRFVNRLFHLTA
jgi:SmpB protein